MGKYQPLTEFLSKQPANEVRMSFEQIERVVGAKLPPSAMEHRAWWSNNPSNSVMTKAWLDAGFRSEQVDMESRKLVFRRVEPQPPIPSTSQVQQSEHAPQQHPLIGLMKGTIWIAPGVDLTKPAMPEWGEVAYGDKAWEDVK
jgi:hypothetical protein